MVCNRNEIMPCHLELDLDGIQSDEDVLDEFYDICHIKQCPVTVARLSQNISKNRYMDVLPADFSRVTLKNFTYTSSDYINASWLEGCNSNYDYIATQGPLKSTITDFYEMIYENNVRTIVMLTNFDECGYEKCYNYLPYMGSTLCLPNQMTIKIISTESNSFSTTTLLEICYKDKCLLSKHYYFTEWKDQKVPQSPDNIVAFQQNIQNDSKFDTYPKVIHCSAGVGRTGTFIAIDFAIRNIINNKESFNFIELIKKMRLSRPCMVQTFEQYRLIYKAISKFKESNQYK